MTFLLRFIFKAYIQHDTINALKSISQSLIQIKSFLRTFFKDIWQRYIKVAEVSGNVCWFADVDLCIGKMSKKIKSSTSHGERDGNGSMKKSKVDRSHEDDIASIIHSERKGFADDISLFKFNKKRCRLLSTSSDIGQAGGGVLYWMSRDQRVQGNTWPWLSPWYGPWLEISVSYH